MEMERIGLTIHKNRRANEVHRTNDSFIHLDT